MADSERRSLVRSIKRDLLTLPEDELILFAKSLGPMPGVDLSRLTSEDEESCFQYISGVMNKGHRAMGCLKKPSRQGNWDRSLSRDNQ
uniref:Uncharacterized protein n=1 Tax=Knipowitschia caucasica TaxID=637954 RepID=A0AAV2JXG7_KNICA